MEGASNRLIDAEALSEHDLRTLERYYARAGQARQGATCTSPDSHSVEEAREHHIEKLRQAEAARRVAASAATRPTIPAWPEQSSFDITSTIDFQEVDNALNQARKEVGQRYDFKGATADIALNATDKTLTLVADDEMKMNALWEIVQTRLVRRGVADQELQGRPTSEPGRRRHASAASSRSSRAFRSKPPARS